MDREKYFDTAGIKGRYQQAIAGETAKALTLFCGQEQEFEQAIEQSGKTFQECLDTVVKGIGTSSSDINVYRRAARFYFEGAEIHFSMTIDLCGDVRSTPPDETKSEQKSEQTKLKFSLDSLLDF